MNIIWHETVDKQSYGTSYTSVAQVEELGIELHVLSLEGDPRADWCITEPTYSWLHGPDEKIVAQGMAETHEAAKEEVVARVISHEADVAYFEKVLAEAEAHAEDYANYEPF